MRAVLANAIKINCGGDELPGGFTGDDAKYTSSTKSKVQWHWENPTDATKSVLLTNAYASNMDPLIYEVPVQNIGSTYDVTLIFGENRGDMNETGRIINVYLNSMRLSENLDVLRDAGGLLKPYKLEKKDVKPLDGGYFQVRIVPKTGNAYISAIEVIPKMEAPKLERLPKLSVTFDKRLEGYPIKVFEAGGTVMGWVDKYLVVFTGFYDFPGVTPAVYQRCEMGASGGRNAGPSQPHGGHIRVWETLFCWRPKRTGRAQWQLQGCIRVYPCKPHLEHIPAQRAAYSAGSHLCELDEVQMRDDYRWWNDKRSEGKQKSSLLGPGYKRVEHHR